MSWNDFFQSSVTAVLTLIGGLILVNVSERFRRFALWEPFAKNLWDQQIVVCSEIVSIVNEAFNNALFCFDTFNPSRRNQRKCAKNLSSNLNQLAKLKGKRLVLCSPSFNQSIEMFTQQMLVILGYCYHGKLNQQLSSNLPKLWFDLVDESRRELRVDSLNSKTKEIIKESFKTQIGNQTLPY